jgi:hypothetical protein
MSDQAFRIEVAGLYSVKMSTTVMFPSVRSMMAVSLRRDTTSLNRVVVVSALTENNTVHIHDTVIVDLPIGSVITMWVDCEDETPILFNTSMSIYRATGRNLGLIAL